MTLRSFEIQSIPVEATMKECNKTYKAMTLPSLAVQSNYMGHLHTRAVYATMEE